MRDVTTTPSINALRNLFFAAARAEHAARENRYRGSVHHLNLLRAVNAVHPCGDLEAAIETLRDTVAASKVELPFTTDRSNQ
jgi:hypothetical protein